MVGRLRGLGHYLLLSSMHSTHLRHEWQRHSLIASHLDHKSFQSWRLRPLCQDALSGYPGSEFSETFGLTAPENPALILDGRDGEEVSVRLVNASFKAILNFAKKYKPKMFSVATQMCWDERSQETVGDSSKWSISLLWAVKLKREEKALRLHLFFSCS